MLFCLRARDGSLQYLLNNKQYTVGRKECDILITNDQSISRKHAQFTVKVDQVILCDCGSRYNTYINNLKLEANIETILKCGDVIKFGMLQSTYILEQISIVTTTSSIKSNQKLQLKNNIQFLGGSFVQNWNPHCTHVSVEEILLTVKVLCAIVKGIPIVKLKYWDDYVENVKQNLPPPEVSNYKPICSEMVLSQNISFEFNIERQSVFKNKMFVFPTKNDKMKMIDLIKLAGGEATSWDTNPITKADVNNSPTKYILLQTSELSDSKQDAGLLDMISYISSLGKRTIPFQEIALAIINNSCEKDCNPDFDRSGTVLALRTQEEGPKGGENVLAAETQSQSQVFDCMDTETVKPDIIIPRSATQGDLVIEDTPNVQESEKTSPPIKTQSIMEASQNEAEGGVKREGESMEGLIVAKKVKVDSTPLFTKGKQKKGAQNSLEFNSQLHTENERQSGKSLFAFKNDTDRIENANPDSKNVVLNPFAKKRKASPSDNENPPKKSSAAIGTSLSGTPPPSTSKASITSVENPFANILKSRNSAVNSRNSQISVISKPKSTLLSSTVINENTSSLQIDLSEIEAVEVSLDKSNGWITKTTCGNSTVGKPLSKMNGFGETIDEELMRYIESFKNTVVIVKEETMVVRKSAVFDNDSSLTSTNGSVKNFKKFKKIQPLRIQTTMIPESKYVDIICNEKCAIQVVREESESDDNDDGMGTQQTARRKRGGKRFEF